jgi:inhibitor of KinA
VTVPSVVPVADHAVLVAFGQEITDATLARIHALDIALSRHRPLGMIEIVPALTHLLVAFDPLVTDHQAITAAVLANLDTLTTAAAGANHVIEVCYESEFALDLQTVAQRTGLGESAVIASHLSATYTVGMYGFAPGYAYLYGTPTAIELPRNPTPGPVIPAGSVIIAGQQCLIIPTAMSTGWFAIGRCPIPMLTDDPARPFLFDVGDTVTFRSIDASGFEQLSSQ